MVALSVIMMDELSDGTAQRLLTEEDHPLQSSSALRRSQFLTTGHLANKDGGNLAREPSEVNSILRCFHRGIQRFR